LRLAEADLILRQAQDDKEESDKLIEKWPNQSNRASGKLENGRGLVIVQTTENPGNLAAPGVFEELID